MAEETELQALRQNPVFKRELERLTAHVVKEFTEERDRLRNELQRTRHHRRQQSDMRDSLSAQVKMWKERALRAEDQLKTETENENHGH